MSKNIKDFHCHLLPSLDDGATDAAESLAMARILSDFGFSQVYCTPHRIKGCFENPPEQIVRATAALQSLLDKESIPLQLIPGSEHYLDEFLIDQLPGALTVERRYLLVELPFRGGSEMIDAMIEGLRARGLTALFAHPERCAAFELPSCDADRGLFSLFGKRQKTPNLAGSLIDRLHRSGIRFQGNLGSFAGRYGREVKQRALFFLEHDLYGCLGSDAHRSEQLEQVLSAGLSEIVARVGQERAFRLLRGADL